VLTTPIHRLRLLGGLEGVSFLLLLGVAMPLKYLAHVPQAVFPVGLAHGLLFLAYLAALGQVAFAHRWPVSRLLLGVGASVVPFGPFLFDGQLRREAQSDGAGAALESAPPAPSSASE
jgi:integral membrane protein